ncbi:hypothetical protein BT96DRAFT_818664 [Gymnopus androsaceus JB14]|uniref:GPR1/FUN34/YaaH-class plasma membrane protein n=1 Tax=Gymnopus androsaceus JB14 TaxID=1447944 RepID=A0A6A4HT34_9AGAR|nr:hypothetical protein BT96DRAFT_818664 [Gymnopus androsaceus JB14]
MASKEGRTISTSHDLEKGEIQPREDSEQSRPVQYTPEQYERLFLTPGGRAPLGNIARKFGNPTPIGVICFLLVVAPTAFVHMGWGGVTPAAVTALVGPYYMLGGMAQFVAGIMEWIMGNTFPSVVFMNIWRGLLTLSTSLRLAWGIIFDPSNGIASSFPGGSSSPEYNKALMFYFAFWTFLTTVYFVTSLRTNLVFAAVFFSVTFAHGLAAASFGELANGNAAVAAALLKSAGAFEFAVVCFAAYLFVALMFESVDMPFRLPLGDLSNAFSKKTKLS